MTDLEYSGRVREAEAAADRCRAEAAAYRDVLWQCQVALVDTNPYLALWVKKVLEAPETEQGATMLAELHERRGRIADMEKAFQQVFRIAQELKGVNSEDSDLIDEILEVASSGVPTQLEN